MLQLYKLFFFIFIILTVFNLTSYAQQTENVLILTKQSNQKKNKKIEANSYFKIKTIQGTKLKGKYADIRDNYFISVANDTIFLEEIIWIKAKTGLTKWGTGIAITTTFAGIFFSFGTIPAAFMIMAMEGNALIFLAPVATVSSSVIGIRMLGGRKYNMEKWRLETQQFFN